MRFLATIAIFALLFGLVGLTQSWLDPGRHRSSEHDPIHGRQSPMDASGVEPYRIRLTPTFDASADPFAVRTAGEDPVRLLVRSGERILYSRTKDWYRGEPVDLDGVEWAGDRGELFIMATPSEAESGRSAGIRVEVFQADGMRCDDRTLWSESGSIISQRAVFSLRRGGDVLRHGEALPDVGGHGHE